MEDLRCYSLHFFYRIEGAEVYGGETGYAKISINEGTKNLETFTAEKFAEMGNSFKQGIANETGTTVENVHLISRDEYAENTNSENTDYFDEEGED